MTKKLRLNNVFSNENLIYVFEKFRTADLSRRISGTSVSNLHSAVSDVMHEDTCIQYITQEVRKFV